MDLVEFKQKLDALRQQLEAENRPDFSYKFDDDADYYDTFAIT